VFGVEFVRTELGGEQIDCRSRFVFGTIEKPKHERTRTRRACRRLNSFERIRKRTPNVIRLFRPPNRTVASLVPQSRTFSGCCADERRPRRKRVDMTTNTRTVTYGDRWRFVVRPVREFPVLVVGARSKYPPVPGRIGEQCVRPNDRDGGLRIR